MISYQPPGDIKNEEELAEDIYAAILAIIDAENALENDDYQFCDRTMDILSELAERKRIWIKSFEIELMKIDALRENHQKKLDSHECLPSEVKASE